MNDAYHSFKVINKRCSICQSPLRDEIDAMLLGERFRSDGKPYRYADIVEWANERGERISEASLSRHYVNHVQPSLRTMMEVQAQIEALNEATGKRLSLHAAFSNIVTSKVLRQLDKLGDKALDDGEIDKLLRVAIMAGRNSLQIERTENLLNQETIEAVDKQLSERLAGKIAPETLETIRTEVYGLAPREEL